MIGDCFKALLKLVEELSTYTLYPAVRLPNPLSDSTIWSVGSLQRGLSVMEGDGVELSVISGLSGVVEATVPIFKAAAYDDGAAGGLVGVHRASGGDASDDVTVLGAVAVDFGFPGGVAGSVSRGLTTAAGAVGLLLEAAAVVAGVLEEVELAAVPEAAPTLSLLFGVARLTSTCGNKQIPHQKTVMFHNTRNTYNSPIDNMFFHTTSLLCAVFVLIHNEPKASTLMRLPVEHDLTCNYAPKLFKISAKFSVSGVIVKPTDKNLVVRIVVAMNYARTTAALRGVR
jgi:hypothetical protein